LKGGHIVDNKIIGERIRQTREERNMTIEELGKAIGVHRSTINRYETGSIISLKMPVLQSIAKALNVNPMWIISKSDKKHLVDYSSIANDLFVTISKENNGFRSFEVIGDVACGNPIVNDEVVTEMMDLPDLVKNADRVLVCKGDSMVGVGVKDGDYVFVRLQNHVENGEIAVVCVDAEITLKRVYRSNGIISLVAENPKYPPMNFTESSSQTIRIVGKAVAFISKL
jgi:repressor LexA